MRKVDSKWLREKRATLNRQLARLDDSRRDLYAVPMTQEQRQVQSAELIARQNVIWEELKAMGVEK